MKLHIDIGGTVLEWERRPMSAERFSEICKLASNIVYTSAAVFITHLCGIYGLLIMAGLVCAFGFYRFIKSV